MIYRSRLLLKPHMKSGEVTLDPSKVSDIESNGNMLSFQADAQDFVIEVVGFDTHRDLKLASSISTEESTDDPEV